jgi:D-tyrosyl-tRNA(Tyr) deacylase
VSQASVEIDGVTTAEIGRGLLVLLAVERGDQRADVDYLVDKVINLRVFPDGEDRMNLSVQEAGGEVLVVSQFTLAGDCRKGRRPSFDHAEDPERAETVYASFLGAVRERGISARAGTFRAAMQVALINDGPVTILLSSKKEF